MIVLLPLQKWGGVFLFSRKKTTAFSLIWYRCSHAAHTTNSLTAAHLQTCHEKLMPEASKGDRKALGRRPQAEILLPSLAAAQPLRPFGPPPLIGEVIPPSFLPSLIAAGWSAS